MSKKREKNQNALKHGAYSRAVMLPGEKLKDYEALRAAHYDEWVPDGVTEKYLVDDLCKLRWKKLRMDQYDQIRLKQRIDQIDIQNDANKITNDLKDLAAQFSEAMSVEATEEILSRLRPDYAEIITEWVPRENCTDTTQWGQEIGKRLSDIKAEDLLEGPDLFAAIVDPDLMELEISRSDRLDEAIDRKIKRIMQVKTAKQIFPNMRKNTRPEPKLIKAPASADQQPVLTTQSEPKPAADTEFIVPAKSGVEGEVCIVQSGVVTQGIRIGEVGSAPGAAEKERWGLVRAKVEVFAKPEPTTLEELQTFSAFCNRVRDSDASSNRAPNAGST